MNVTVQPDLLKWARERASLAPQELARMVGTKAKPAPIEEWERTGELPLKKLEAIAAKTHAPFGFFFLSEPPTEPIPIHDFRRPNGSVPQHPSINLLETIYGCQFRQTWMSAHLQAEGEEPLDFVGSASISDDPKALGRTIRERLRIGTQERSQNRTLADATLWMISQIQNEGILVFRNGVVGNQTRRALNEDEFKGFALADRFAPLIFINGRDWPASQMFTIAHECAHIWLGESALPDGDWYDEPNNPVEQFCNRVAAEILMPEADMREWWREDEQTLENTQRLSRQFHVSGLALLVRAKTLDLISEGEFNATRAEEEQAFKEAAPKRTGSGGNYYNTVGTRLSKRFIRTVLASTLEGKTLYGEAFELLGTKKTTVFQKMVEEFLQGSKP
jgi:Zn-dependent peptidase ImmA (M78 family)